LRQAEEKGEDVWYQPEAIWGSEIENTYCVPQEEIFVDDININKNRIFDFGCMLA
jgi:hypothetical protein